MTKNTAPTSTDSAPAENAAATKHFVIGTASWSNRIEVEGEEFPRTTSVVHAAAIETPDGGLLVTGFTAPVDPARDQNNYTINRNSWRSAIYAVTTARTNQNIPSFGFIPAAKASEVSLTILVDRYQVADQYLGEDASNRNLAGIFTRESRPYADVRLAAGNYNTSPVVAMARAHAKALADDPTLPTSFILSAAEYAAERASLADVAADADAAAAPETAALLGL